MNWEFEDNKHSGCNATLSYELFITQTQSLWNDGRCLFHYPDLASLDICNTTCCVYRGSVEVFQHQSD